MMFCLGAAVLLSVTGCEIPGKVTGGGFMDGAGGGKANLGFNATQCELVGESTGRVNYHDKSAGVKVSPPNVIRAASRALPPRDSASASIPRTTGKAAM